MKNTTAKAKWHCVTWDEVGMENHEFEVEANTEQEIIEAIWDACNTGDKFDPASETITSIHKQNGKTVITTASERGHLAVIICCPAE